MATTPDKIDAFVTAFITDGENIKAAMATQRKRVKLIQGLIADNLVSDDQAEKLAALLPKKREPKDGA